ncbi:MAG: hypothetical protein ACHQ4H_06505 [Ktedonobacterales bacterium]
MPALDSNLPQQSEPVGGHRRWHQARVQLSMIGPLLALLAFFLPWIAPPWVMSGSFSGWQWVASNLGPVQSMSAPFSAIAVIVVGLPLLAAVVMLVISLAWRHPDAGHLRLYSIVGVCGLIALCSVLVATGLDDATLLVHLALRTGSPIHLLQLPLVIGAGGWLSLLGFATGLWAAHATQRTTRWNDGVLE